MNAVQTCHAWLQSRGADVGNIVVASTSHPDERRVEVAQAVKAGQRVMSLPEACLISTYAVRRCPLGEQLLAAGVQERAELLTAFLLDERSKDYSPWGPYFAALPQSFAHHPSAQIMVLAPALKGTWALQFMMLDARINLRGYQRTYPVLPHLKLDLAAYTWASTAVRTRMFSGTWHGEAVSVLAPFADMMNHALDPDVAWSASETPPGFTVTATRDLRAGQEVCDSYGSKSNSTLFARYGFILDGNPRQEAMLHVRPNAPLTGPKLALMKEAGPFSFVVQPDWNDAHTVKILSCIRVLLAADSDVEALVARGVSAENVPPLNKQNEDQAHAALQALAREAQVVLLTERTMIARLPEHLRAPVRAVLAEEAHVLGFFSAAHTPL